MVSELSLLIRPGLVIAMISGLLAIVLLFLVFFDRHRYRARQSARREALEQARAGGLPQNKQQIDALWSEAIKSMDSLQEQMMGELSGLETRVKSEREEPQLDSATLETPAGERSGEGGGRGH